MLISLRQIPKIKPRQKKKKQIPEPVNHDVHLIRGLKAGNYRPIKAKEVTQFLTTAPLLPGKSQRLSLA